ncbi:MAG: hypothetical protein JNK84_06660 [Phreatobacter sp.]|uniref:hypothetical protein n=1 Tax=Phreatobacter sp. TaxID=1966341 RepID=UPI001A3C1B7F|nr:hypothetical protein [Phreatobacter sp.]MBL8568751.1 hypothetical protein [Phreatobacter sp.]
MTSSATFARDALPDAPARAATDKADVRRTRWERADWRNIAMLAAVWIAAIFIVDPRGEFPLVDDWAWAASVRALVDEGTLRLSDWAAGNLITHTLWGALFAWPFGASFLTLRAAMLVMGFIGIVALYGWLRLIPLKPSTALLGAASLMANPIYFALSYTFMTDVTYAALQTVSMWLISFGLVGGAGSVAAWGWAIGLAALLARQTGMAIPLGHAGAHVGRYGLTWRTLALAILPVLVFYAVQKGYIGWLDATGRLPLQYGLQSDSILTRLRGPIGKTVLEAVLLLGCAFFYLGFFSLPVSLVVWADELGRLKRRRERIRLIAAFLIFSTAASIAIITIERPMPIWWDTITEWGIGNDAIGPWATWPYRYAFTWLSALGGALGTVLLAMRVWTVFTDRSDSAVTAMKLFAGLTMAVLLAPVLFIIDRFDRYFIPMVPCLIVVLFASPGIGERLARVAWPARATAWVLIAATGLFSVLATHDFLSTKRAQAAALERLVAQGVPRDRINAGWSFNGWHLHGKVGQPNRLSTWHNEPEYLILVDRMPGYRVVDQVPVTRRLPWATHASPILILRQIPDYPRVYGPIRPEDWYREWEDFFRERRN